MLAPPKSSWPFTQGKYGDTQGLLDAEFLGPLVSAAQSTGSCGQTGGALWTLHRVGAPWLSHPAPPRGSSWSREHSWARVVSQQPEPCADSMTTELGGGGSHWNFSYQDWKSQVLGETVETCCL